MRVSSRQGRHAESPGRSETLGLITARREVKPAVVMNTLCGRFAIILATSVIDRALRQFDEAAKVPSYESYGCLAKGVLLDTAPR
jgi:hypothetical protein